MRDWLRYCSYNSDIDLPCLNCKSFVKNFGVLTYIILDRLLGVQVKLFNLLVYTSMFVVA